LPTPSQLTVISPATRLRPGVDAAPPDVGAGSEGPDVLRVLPWVDPVVDALGYDPRSWYVEQFWLGIIGPTSTWLLRRLVARFDAEPDGFDLDLHETPRALGLGDRPGRHSPFRRAVGRCVQFKLARPQGPTAIAVRRRIPPLPLRLKDRLPPSLQELHTEWLQSQHRSEMLADVRARARRMALHLVDVESDPEALELHLLRRRVHPAIAHETSRWVTSLVGDRPDTPA
jgi:hypothetical protein